MKLEFDIKITAKELYDFMLYHTYTGFSGLFGTVIGALFIIYFFMAGVWYYLVAGLVIIFYIPCSLYMRAKRQALTNEFFKKPIHYVLSEDGVTVMQGEYDMTLPWDSIAKATASNRSIFVYTSKVNAWIFPKSLLGEQKNDLIQIISEHVAPDKIKIKQ